MATADPGRSSPAQPGMHGGKRSPTPERTPPLTLDDPTAPSHDLDASERLDWDLPLEKEKMLSITAPMPAEFRRKLETGVTNGDCLPACFAAMLECFHRGHIASPSLTAAASDMRRAVCGWIKANWEKHPVFNPEMKVHEIIRLLHDFSIPESERELRGDWGDDPSSQLAKYASLCDRLYFSDAEMLMFSSMMWERRRLPVMFRVFRVESDPHNSSVWRGTYQTTTPDPDTFLKVTQSDHALLIDVAHVGHQDGWGAHYKLLINSSIDGLTKCRQKQRPAGQPAGQPAARSADQLSPNLLPQATRRRLWNSPGAPQNGSGAQRRHVTSSKRLRAEEDAWRVDL